MTGEDISFLSLMSVFLLGCMFPCVIYKKVGYFESGCFKKQLISSVKNVIKQGTFFLNIFCFAKCFPNHMYFKFYNISNANNLSI